MFIAPPEGAGADRVDRVDRVPMARESAVIDSNKDDLSFLLDLGEVGYQKRYRFSVKLEATGLLPLIEQAQAGHRVYELMQIGRPDDIWAYVWVAPVHLPPRLVSRVLAIRIAAAKSCAGAHPWPDKLVPFPQFDKLFMLMGDDTDPEDEVWRRLRDSEPMKCFASRTLDRVLEVQRSLENGDPVMRHELKRVKTKSHPYDFLSRDVALDAGRKLPIPRPALHSEAFYAKLAQLLADPQLSSVAYRARGDYRVIRMLCNEQRRRADQYGCEPGQALRLSLLANFSIDNNAWDSEVWMYDEGLSYGDLFIEENRDSGSSVRALHGSPFRKFGRNILSFTDEGELPGYASEAGDGWVHYRAEPASDLDARYAQPRTDLEFQVRRALELLKRSDAVVVAAGAGTGVDSGLKVFQGSEGFWKAYPALGRAGIGFTQIASPQAFRDMPERAWGFYGHRLALYRKTRPHQGVKVLGKWGAKNGRELAIYTSNEDGQFQAAGYSENQIVECRGSVHWLQCLDGCSQDVWPADDFVPEVDDEEGVLLNAAPRCRHCGGLARPNVLMFNDEGWSPARCREQQARQNEWLAEVKRPAVFEIGVGAANASVRNFTERLSNAHGASLIRINPRDASVRRGLDVPLPMTALEAPFAIEAQRMFVR